MQLDCMFGNIENSGRGCQAPTGQARFVTSGPSFDMVGVSMARRSRRAEREQRIREQLREAGLRVTAARILVMETLQAAAGPMSHAEVVEALAGSAGDPATVFRNLTALTEASLAVRSDLGDRVWRFAAKQSSAGEGHEHPHFLCSECGTVECMPAVELRARPGQRLPRSVRNLDAEVQIKGRCDDCAEAADTTSN
jgi:Fur family ferric uptake transcriptional regulator